MGLVHQGGFTDSAGFKRTSNSPIDDSTIVEFLTDLTDGVTLVKPYRLMIVSVEETNKPYQWNGQDISDISNWKLLGNEKSSALNSDTEETVATSRAVKLLKDFIDNLRDSLDDIDSEIQNIDNKANSLQSSKLDAGHFQGNADDIVSQIVTQLIVKDENDIEQYRNILRDGIKIKGVAFNPAQKYFEIPSVNVQDIYYLDHTLPNSNNSEINRIDRPFHDLPELITALNANPDDGRTIIIHALTIGQFTGAALPLRNIIWNASTYANYNFTGVRTLPTSESHNNELGYIISSVSTDSVKDVSYTFVNNKISLISNTNDAQQHFGTRHGTLRLYGHLRTFNFKSTKLPILTSDNSDLTITDFYGYIVSSANAYKFGTDSKIKIKRFFVESSLVAAFSSKNDCYLTIERLILKDGNRFVCSHEKLLTVKKVEGQGIFQSGSSIEKVTVFFENCQFDDNSIYWCGGGTIKGEIISNHYAVESGNGSSVLFENFKAKVKGIKNNTILFKGFNSLEVEGTSTIATNFNEFRINGILEIFSLNPNQPLLSDNNGSVVTNYGVLLTNVDNIGVGYEQFNNEYRLNYKGNQINQTLPVYANDSEAISNGLVSNDWYKDNDGNIKSVTIFQEP